MFIETELYKNILKNVPVPTVDILFLNTSWELLLAKRNNKPLMGVYYIPGWRVNKWERSLDAAKRKAFEELWITIDVSKLQFIGVYDDIFENSAFEDISTHCIPVTYLYRLTLAEESQLVLGDSQHSDISFFHISDISLHEIIKKRIEDIKRFALYA
jgi:colanic acid biosynthesis protein WcaH